MKRVTTSILLAVALVSGCDDGTGPGVDALTNSDGIGPADVMVAGDGYRVDTADAAENRLDGFAGDGSGVFDTYADVNSGTDVPGDSAGAPREFGLDVINIGYDPEFSQCGGFGTGDDADLGYRDPFCGASMMKWSVDTATGEIRLLFENLYFNCCGEHEIAVENDDGVIVVTLIDRPTEVGQRCECTCGYDYAVTMPPLKDAIQASFRVYYFIDELVCDDDGCQQPEPRGSTGTFWIDLASGSGEVPIGETMFPCMESLYQANNVRISECGGFEQDDGNCRPETFEWQYNPDTNTMSVINRNVVMNCCAERHAYSIRDPYYGLEIAELDVPPDSGRCDCKCMIDYSMDLWEFDPNVSEYSIIRTVPDADVPGQVIFNDYIDETTPGVVVIREAAQNCI